MVCSTPSLPRQPTVLDVRNAHEAILLMERLQKDGGDPQNPANATDALVARLHALFVRFPPTEECMQYLSMEQQRLEGTGGMSEYATTTVYLVATLSLADG